MTTWPGSEKNKLYGNPRLFPLSYLCIRTSPEGLCWRRIGPARIEIWHRSCLELIRIVWFFRFCLPARISMNYQITDLTKVWHRSGTELGCRTFIFRYISIHTFSFCSGGGRTVRLIEMEWLWRRQGLSCWWCPTRQRDGPVPRKVWHRSSLEESIFFSVRTLPTPRTSCRTTVGTEFEWRWRRQLARCR